MSKDCDVALSLLQSVLKKCHIRTVMLSLQDSMDALLDGWLGSVLGGAGEAVRTVLGTPKDKTKYRLVNRLHMHYIFMRLPLLSEKNLFFIGPYLSAPLSPEAVLELGESLGLSPAAQKPLAEYYAALPVVTEDDRLLLAVDAFCEAAFGTDAFLTEEIDANGILPLSPLSAVSGTEGAHEAMADIEAMEQRYAFENQMIETVRRGQLHKEKLLSFILTTQMFEQRVQDPVRNAKNYCIIMNTLLRKAAEEGGVHPLHIHHLSSKLALRIEQVGETKQIPALMREMFSAYCRLVHKHTTAHFSPVVKKTVLLIDADLSAELSLRSLAEAQHVSPGYLSTVFRKETGKTLSAYLRDARIHRAMHLLSTTGLQIQTVASLCGIMDVQYFSKLFKQQTGKTPKEYRAAARR